ncbi:hypothetical protein HUJ05_000898 [Dendroctonus ponderosae]|nr:hypothetical protein HUJ05_000898 [Dendroctonus ponderosae]
MEKTITDKAGFSILQQQDDLSRYVLRQIIKTVIIKTNLLVMTIKVLLGYIKYVADGGLRLIYSENLFYKPLMLAGLVYYSCERKHDQLSRKNPADYINDV